MNAPRAEFDLVAAQSPCVDRRALSQAWYSALRLAGHSPRARPAPKRDALPCSEQRARPLFARAAPGTAKSPIPLAGRPRGLAPARNLLGTGRARSERRAEPSSLAQAITSKLTSSPRVSRFVVESARGRVTVHVLRRDDRVHLVALCGTAMRADVEKAMAHARFALAGIGVHVR